MSSFFSGRDEDKFLEGVHRVDKLKGKAAYQQAEATVSNLRILFSRTNLGYLNVAAAFDENEHIHISIRDTSKLKSGLLSDLQKLFSALEIKNVNLLKKGECSVYILEPTATSKEFGAAIAAKAKASNIIPHSHKSSSRPSRTHTAPTAKGHVI